MDDAQEFMSRDSARAERSSKTRELLAAAAASADPEQRRVLLGKAAELNHCVVDAVVASMARRYSYTEVDLRALAECARKAYTHAVLTLDPTPDLDLLTRVVPAVRDAIQHCVRTQLAEEGPVRPR